MSQPGGLEKDSVSWKTVKNAVERLEDRGLIYSRKTKDFPRKQEYSYYSVVPNCANVRSGKCGIPHYIKKQTDHYLNVLEQHYSALLPVYVPLVLDYDLLHEEFGRTLNKPADWDYVNFPLLYQSLKNRSQRKTSKEFKITPSQVEALNKILEKWGNNQWTTKQSNMPPLFLEDLTMTLVEFTTSYLVSPVC